MRYTPFLDRYGITFKEDVPDHAVNIIDSALAIISAGVEWGSSFSAGAERKRKPCPEQPVLLSGQPLGQYHCPCCGMMLLAGLPHFAPLGYEAEYGRDWPPGYEEA